MIKSTFLYGLITASLILLLKYIDYRLFTGYVSFEVYAGLIALIFTVLGVVIGLKLTNRKVTIEANEEKEFVINEHALKTTGISTREYDVLELMSKGFSNKEIAEELYISLNTVKTHASSLFSKLHAKRRTQAIQQAKEKGILP